MIMGFLVLIWGQQASCHDGLDIDSWKPIPRPLSGRNRAMSWSVSVVVGEKRVTAFQNNSLENKTMYIQQSGTFPARRCRMLTRC